MEAKKLMPGVLNSSVFLYRTICAPHTVYRLSKCSVAFLDLGEFLVGLLILSPKGVSVFVKGKRGSCQEMNWSRANISKLKFTLCYINLLFLTLNK